MFHSPSALIHEYKAAQPLKSVTSKALLLFNLLTKGAFLTSQEKGSLKDLLISGNATINHAVECFEIDNDLTELADTLKIVLKSPGISYRF